VILDSAGNLYGTAPGGESQDGYYFGVVRKIDTSGNQTVLYAFCSHDLCEGTVSRGVTFDTAGNFYVTTSTGPGEAGILYKLDQSGNETHLYQFLGHRRRRSNRRPDPRHGRQSDHPASMRRPRSSAKPPRLPCSGPSMTT